MHEAPIKPRVLVVDDDLGNSTALKDEFVRSVDPTNRCEFVFCSGQEDRTNSMEKVRGEIARGWPPRSGAASWSIVLLDVMFVQKPQHRGDKAWGFEVLQALREEWPDLPIVMLTAQTDARQQANWGQADGFLSKPAHDDALAPISFLMALYSFGLFPDLRDGTRLAGTSLAILKVLQQARQFACDPLGSGRILYGETGTGKTEFARLIHDEMNLLVGRKGSFHSWSAAGANEDITKSALFGHWKGAYTDAGSPEPGRIERAHGGTFFLDEVATLGSGAQALFIESRRRNNKLQRLVSRMGKFPVGRGTPKAKEEIAEALQSIVPKPVADYLQDDHRIAVDVVILTASNVNLHDEDVADDIGFRRDLLNDLGAPIYIPSLNERRDDIPEIFEHILSQIARHMDRPPKHVHRDVLNDLTNRNWTKTNIVALRQIAEHALIAARDFDEILMRHLPPRTNLPNWPGSKPRRSVPTSHRMNSDPRIELTNTPGIVELPAMLDALHVPLDVTILHGLLPKVQTAYARLVLRMLSASLEASKQRGESSSLQAVRQLLGVTKLESQPESHAAYDIVLRLVGLCDAQFRGLSAADCELLSDDEKVSRHVKQALDKRRPRRRETEQGK